MMVHKGPASSRPRCTRGGSPVATMPIYHLLLLHLETEEWLQLHGGPRQFFPVPCLRESSRLHRANLDSLHDEAALLQLLADQNKLHSGVMTNAVLRCKNLHVQYTSIYSANTHIYTIVLFRYSTDAVCIINQSN
jgi:hypothetical protein